MSSWIARPGTARPGRSDASTTGLEGDGQCECQTQGRRGVAVAKVNPQIISVVGWHNSGKTTFIERLVPALKARGLRVAVIKHSGGGFELDHPGTDTWRFQQAGSDVVAIVGREGFAYVERRQSGLDLEELVARLTG